MRDDRNGWRRRSVVGALALTVALAALHPVSVTACFTPGDLYAVEVVLNKPNVKYNLSLLVGAREVEYAGIGRAYAYRSRFDSRLVVLLSEQPVPVFTAVPPEPPPPRPILPETEDRDRKPGPPPDTPRVPPDTPKFTKYLAIRVQVPLEERVVTVHSCVINLGCVPRFRGRVPLAFGAGKGKLTIEVGELFLSLPSFVQFKPEISVKVEGNASLVVSGELLLRGVAKKSGQLVEYRVMMPCLVNVNEPCTRIDMLIPGYDAPMELEAGKYEVSLTLNWRASRPAEGVLRFIRVNCPAPIPVAPLEVVGERLGWKVTDSSLEKVVGEAVIRVSQDRRGYVVTVEGVEEVSEAVEEEIGKLLDALGLGRGVCKLVRRKELRLTPQAEVSEEEVRAALRAELEWLVREGVVTGLEAGDVADIVKAAKLGYAGWNWRLVWHEGKWVPHGTVPGAIRVKCFVDVVTALFLTGSEEYRALPQAPTLVEGEAVRQRNYWLWTWAGAWAVAVAVAFVAALLSYAVVKSEVVRRQS